MSKTGSGVVTSDALHALASRLCHPDQCLDACDEAARVLRQLAGENDDDDGRIWNDTEPVHLWFELSYAEYLTIPRSVLQLMPREWQRRFVRCLCELDRAIDWRPECGQRYRVTLHRLVEKWDRNESAFVERWGPKLEDPYADYERGRRRVPLRSPDDGVSVP